MPTSLHVLKHRGRGCRKPKDIHARIRQSWLKHGRRLMALRDATQADYDGSQYLTGVDDQEQCGDCWNFAGVNASAAAAVKAGAIPNTANWSKQSVLDCGSNGGCNGDWPETAFEQVKNSGVADTTAYPYVGGPSGHCRNIPHPNTLGVNGSYGYVGSQDGVPPTQALKNAMFEHGTLQFNVDASEFDSYSGGIMVGGPSSNIDHAIQAYGWHDYQPGETRPQGSTASGYWKGRNQWGKDWGENGNCRIEYGAFGFGDGAMWAIYDNGTTPAPSPSPSPTPTPNPQPTPTPVPIPTTQQVVVIPDQTVSFGFRGSAVVKGGTYPVQTVASTIGSAGAVNWLALFTDVPKTVADATAAIPAIEQILADIQSKNLAALLQDGPAFAAAITPFIADVKKLVVDFGGPVISATAPVDPVVQGAMLERMKMKAYAPIYEAARAKRFTIEESLAKSNLAASMVTSDLLAQAAAECGATDALNAVFASGGGVIVQILAAIVAFLESPTGQQVIAALIAMLLTALGL